MTGDRKAQALNREVRAQLVRSQRSHRDLAQALDLSMTQTSARLTGRVTWRIDELWTAAELCGIDLASLITTAEATAGQRVAS